MEYRVHFRRPPQSKSMDMVMISELRRLWCDDNGQDSSEYAVMLAVVLTVTLMTIRLIAQNSNTVFSQIGSKLS